MFGSDRNQLRQFYQTSWQKFRQNLSLTQLEAQVAAVIQEHPEYHALLLSEDVSQKDWHIDSGATNPFLHLGMHLALREQVLSNRPAGIAHYYRLLCDKHQDALEAEHAMMDCLGQVLWQAQRDNSMPDETIYLTCLKQLTQDLSI